jgi:signal transduction histidine kinase
MRIGVRMKVMLGVLVPLALVLAAFAWVQYGAHRRVALSLAAHSASELGVLVESSLIDAMLAVDRPAVQRTVDNLTADADVMDLVVLDKDGVVRVAPGMRGVGQQRVRTDAGCRSCHQAGQAEPRSASAVVDVPGTGRVLRNCRPIANRPACHTCHASTQGYNGVLITDLPMDAIERHLGEYLDSALLSLAGAMVLGAVVLASVMDRLVSGPVARLTTTVRAIASGDMERRAEIASDDEIGELARAFNHAAEAMAERVDLEREVRRRSADLEALNVALQEKEAARTRLLKQTISAQETERKRVARQLHDELAQSLTGLVMSLDAAEGLLDERVQGARAQLVRTRAIVTEALDQTRRLILDLRPTMLDDLGLVSAIRWYADTHLSATGALVVFAVEGTPRRLAPEAETTLFRIAQEAMNNVARHARATQVGVRMVWDATAVTMIIEDDGRGFDPGAESDEPESGAGMGLLGMRERADMLGGTLAIRSALGKGTRIELRLPTAGEETAG